MRIASLAPLILPLVLSICASCGGVTWEHSESYDNGQFRVLPGNEDAQGWWEGPWFFQDRDGSVMYEETYNGDKSNRTGFYSHGAKVRDLTEVEIERERQRIADYLRRTR